jgi:enoyl-CoA hydratase/carnithine racemase
MKPLFIDVPESLDETGLARLEQALARGARATASAWVLRGRNGVFCKGMALGAMAAREDDPRGVLGRYARLLATLRAAPRPTIAVVDGEVLGGGVGLAASCDRVVSTPRATFGLPEALFGVLPGVVVPALADRMPPQKVRLLALDGASRDARWAEAFGLVDDVVEPDRVDAHVAGLVRQYGRVACERVTGLREWTEQAGRLGVTEGLTRGAEVTAALLREPEVREGLRRFTEEGIPPWQAAS